MNTGFSNNITTPSLNGLVDIQADSVNSSSVSTDTIYLDGIDISSQLNQVPINTSNISALQQVTTGQAYDSGTDKTSFDNNVAITGTLSTTGNILEPTITANSLIITPAEISCLDSIGSNIQTQLNNKVNLTGAETINGIKTFGSVPVCATNCSTSTQLANKSYVDSVIPSTTNFLTTNTAQTLTSAATKTFSNSSIIMNDGTTNATTIKQFSVSNYFEMSQNYNNGGYIFTSKIGSGINKSVSINGNSLGTEEIRVLDSAGNINYTRHNYSNPNYTIENTANGNIYFKTYSGTGIITSTPLTINSTNCTFDQPPICTIAPTTANMMTNKSYTDNAISTAITSNNLSYVNNAGSPIGSIILHSSNTIPTGWLLCDGSQVSKITYADLFAVIGNTYNNGATPTTGNFILPNFKGLYARGAGSNSNIICETTTLGQVSVGQVGKHAHQSATMNTDTQGTTTTKNVCETIGGLVGLIVGKVNVAAPLVTTTATNGTATTTTNTYNSTGTLLTDETRPNNISMNYIIKYTGASVPITDPSFTQSTNVLTIQNNYATSGIINFQVDDASSVLQTPLSLSSAVATLTGQLKLSDQIISTSTVPASRQISTTFHNMYDNDTTAGGTYRGRLYSSPTACYIELAGASHIFAVTAGGTGIFQLDSTGVTTRGIIGQGSVVSQSPSTTNKILIYADATSTKNYIQSSSTNVSGSTCDLIFGGYQNSVSYATFNAEGINLNAGQGSYLFGRNDGVAFNGTLSANGLYPIGTVLEYKETPVTFTTGTQFNYTTVLPQLKKGVWLVSGNLYMLRGTGVFTAASYMRLDITNGASGIQQYPTTSNGGALIPIASTATASPIQVTFSGTLVCTIDLARPNLNGTIVMTVGTATKSLQVCFTKIA